MGFSSMLHQQAGGTVPLFVSRFPVRLLSAIRVVQYQVQSVFRKKVHFDSSSLPISIATYGHRKKYLHLTVESILSGKVKPSGIHIWVDKSEMGSLPSGMRRFGRQGISISFLEDGHFGHKKWLGPSKHLYEFPKGVVLADDDFFYPDFWLEKLVGKATNNEPTVTAWRVKRITLSSEKIIKPYREWERGTCESSLNFSGTGAGIFLPAGILKKLAYSSDDHLRLTGKNDDVWICSVILSAGVRTQLASVYYPDWPQNPMQGVAGLRDQNVGNGLIDKAVKSSLQPLISQLEK